MFRRALFSFWCGVLDNAVANVGSGGFGDYEGCGATGGGGH